MADKNTTVFIGKQVKVLEATNTTYINIKGVIIDETKNAFLIKTNTSEKLVLKKHVTFEINNEIIQGNKIIKRLENRLKSRRS